MLSPLESAAARMGYLLSQPPFTNACGPQPTSTVVFQQLMGHDLPRRRRAGAIPKLQNEPTAPDPPRRHTKNEETNPPPAPGRPLQ
jgi:hypothetical protein